MQLMDYCKNIAAVGSILDNFGLYSDLSLNKRNPVVGWKEFVNEVSLGSDLDLMGDTNQLSANPGLGQNLETKETAEHNGGSNVNEVSLGSDLGMMGDVDEHQKPIKCKPSQRKI